MEGLYLLLLIPVIFWIVWFFIDAAILMAVIRMFKVASVTYGKTLKLLFFFGLLAIIPSIVMTLVSGLFPLEWRDAVVGLGTMVLAFFFFDREMKSIFNAPTKTALMVYVVFCIALILEQFLMTFAVLTMFGL